MAFTAKDVKALREKTGCGMMDCKKALTEANGDMDKAIDFLREQGLAKQEKKSGRIAAEGVAFAKTNADNTVGVVIEVNAETDFVAKNEKFTTLVETVANTVLASDVTTLEDAMNLDANGNTIEELIAQATATIGEKLSFRRFEVVNKEDTEVFGTYSHMGGKIVALTVLSADEELAKDIAMQVAAMRPLYLNREQVPAEVLEKEKTILREQAENEGLDPNKLDMIVNGRVNKYYEEVCLVDQGFIKENKMKVNKIVESKNSSILSFVRYEVGEGIEKREENFADEVMKQINQ